MCELAGIYKTLGVMETIVNPILTQHSICPTQGKPNISAFIAVVNRSTFIDIRGVMV